jgi:putative endonuclease
LTEQKNNNLGKTGEGIAANYLLRKGYKILQENWRFGKNEIDLIALDGVTTVFVEVKARVTDNRGHPEQAVTITKQRAIKKVADAYLYEYETIKIRFDIIAITFWPGAGTDIRHFEDAFF